MDHLHHLEHGADIPWGGVAGTAPGTSTSDTINLNLTMPDSARAIPLKVGREHVNQLMKESARMHRLRS